MVINWIIIGVLILLGLWLIKSRCTRKIKILVLIILGLLLYTSVVNLFTPQKISLNSPQGIFNAIYVYFGWVGQTLGKLFEVGGDAVRMVGNAIKR
jgi:hypothetical protein